MAPEIRDTPDQCLLCKAGAEKFAEQSGERTWAAEHVIGAAKGVNEDILADLIVGAFITNKNIF